MSIDELEAQAMMLSPEERLSLGERLLSSVDTGLQFEAEWAEEADRRVEEMRSGAVEMIPGDDVFRRALGRLR
ncbi:MAG: addiction module protein [Gemmatimonadota bacterium]